LAWTKNISGRRQVTRLLAVTALADRSSGATYAKATTQLEYGMMSSPLATLLTLLVAVSLPSFDGVQNTSSGDTISAQTPPAARPAWERDLEARHKELIEQNGPGTDAPLREQLLKMYNADQTARGLSSAPAASMQQLSATDAELTMELKQIVDQKGWPAIALVGIQASNAAMTVLTHTADHAWQLHLLPTLEQLADAGKIDPSSLALVVDKELVSEGKLQRYGSQFKAVSDGMAMYGVEDPDQLDQRRAKALLAPMAVYKETLERMYHLKATNAIVSATPTAPRPQN
jgi:hypothetical protein